MDVLGNNSGRFSRPRDLSSCCSLRSMNRGQTKSHGGLCRASDAVQGITRLRQKQTRNGLHALADAFADAGGNEERGKRTTRSQQRSGTAGSLHAAISEIPL